MASGNQSTIFPIIFFNSHILRKKEIVETNARLQTLKGMEFIELEQMFFSVFL